MSTLNSESEWIQSLLTEIEEKHHIVVNMEKNVEGTYGQVFFAKSKHQKFVIKIFKYDITSADIINEIICLTSLKKCKIFPKLHHIICKNNGRDVAIIMDYCGHTMYPHIMMKRNKFFMTVDFINAYKHIYDNFMVHRDIKNNNLCINKQGILSLIDFGYARKVPYVSNDMIIVKVNKHLENFQKKYPMKHTHKVDLLSIFNTIVYIFNCNNSDDAYHYYPITIGTDDEQMDNLIYLLLHRHNTLVRRENVWKMITKITNGKYYRKLESFHHKFEPNTKNQHLYNSYRAIMERIPKKIYCIIKKLLNINPNKRITFGEFYSLFSKEFPIIMEKNKKPIFVPICMEFNYKMIVSSHCASLPFQMELQSKYNTQTYAMTFYHFRLMHDSIPSHEMDLFNTLLYMNYVTMIQNVEVEDIDISIKKKIILQCLNKIKNSELYDNPYNYLHKMRILRWNCNNLTLFDYFLIIFSSINICSLMHPFIITLCITLIIDRTHHKNGIEMDINQSEIMIPSVQPFILTKNTLSLIKKNYQFMLLVNQLYGYYARISNSESVSMLKEYFYEQNALIHKSITFYEHQISKNLRTNN